MDALDCQHTLVLLHFADGFRKQAALPCGNLASFQRAPEGSRESTGSGRDNVVERRGMRLV